MARTKMLMQRGSAMSEHLSFGLLAASFPAVEVNAALKRTGRQGERERDLPARLVVYYVIAMALYMSVSTQEVLRYIMEGLQWLCAGRPWRVPTKGAISRARTRLGPEPLQALWDSCAQPLGQPSTPGTFYHQWRLVSLDGSTLDVPDTATNSQHFGRQKTARGRAAFPKLRMLALAESGTHTIFEARLGLYTQGEQSLVPALLERLQGDMLCLADRGIYGFELWQQARATGAQLLWRVRNNMILPVEEALADGSYLSTLYPRDQDRKKKRRGIRARVIEYRLEGQSDQVAPYRLITTLLDAERYPAVELAGLYAQRWEIEGCFDELKTHLRGPAVVLRSKTPNLVAQEFWGLLLAHWMTRKLMVQAAEGQDLDPDRISFTFTINIIRRHLVAIPGFFPSTPDDDASTHPPRNLLSISHIQPG